MRAATHTVSAVTQNKCVLTANKLSYIQISGNSTSTLNVLHSSARNTVLRQIAAPVSLHTINTNIFQSLCNDLIDTIHQYRGVGVAATQIGVNQQVFAANLLGVDHKDQQIDTIQSTINKPKTQQYTSLNDIRSHQRLSGLRRDFNPTVFINPRILKYGRTVSSDQYEGCFSIPQYIATIPRCQYIRVEYTTQYGELVERDLYGWNARIYLHEYDHLHGRLFIDYLSKDTQLQSSVECVELLKILHGTTASSNLQRE